MPRPRFDATSSGRGSSPKPQLWISRRDASLPSGTALDRRVRWCAGLILIIAGLAGMVLFEDQPEETAAFRPEGFSSASPENPHLSQSD